MVPEVPLQACGCGLRSRRPCCGYEQPLQVWAAVKKCYGGPAGSKMSPWKCSECPAEPADWAGSARRKKRCEAARPAVGVPGGSRGEEDVVSLLEEIAFKKSDGDPLDWHYFVF